METFIGLLLVMGILQFPSIESYWKMDSIYHHSLFHRVPMSYNRFVLLLKCWHFANNEGQDGTRTYKIRPLLDMLMQRTKDLYKPGDTVIVDETMIPFRDKEVINTKLKKGEMCSSQQGYVTFLKWKDQRDVYMLSTCYGDEMVEIGTDRKGNKKMKPKVVLEYNRGKQGVDISDQLASYYTSLRKSLIWYKKIAIELICSTTLINSHIIFNSLTGKNLHFFNIQNQL
ncbi:hypothetical protein NQ314_001407 [Rhamnusium bicolor]|uniref:PiggyBac transposable element-derived protein domain-containing protein n=1 Tax=Rhamnusium bicolor TaxID=1586634 RepID=A0AAV8ZSN0_9CUCU|nr:hypothetical protein NQ314_001407 [Rhamnusium bicolor]